MSIIGPELATLSSNLSLIWSSTQDKTLRKFNLPNGYRYGLWLQFAKNTSYVPINIIISHMFLLILLAGDIATNPGPEATNCYNIQCLYFNARSLLNKTSELQTIVTDIDLLAVTET